MTRRGEILAWMLASLAIGLLVAAAVVGVSAGHPVDDVAGVGLVFSIGLPVLGAVVIRQREGGAIGWLMIGMGLSIALATLGDRWARAALVDDPGSLPGGELASWLQAWAWMPGWVLATTLLPVLLPDGRPVGRHRLLAWVDGLAVAAVVTAIAAASWHVRGTVLISEADDDPRVSTLNQISGVGFVIVGVLTLVSMASLVIRYRGATPGVRRQIAWVVYGAAVAVVAAVIGMFADLGGLVQTLEASALVGGLAVAMFRYRLYDIDAVVNRTLVYGALTAILAGTYLGSVLGASACAEPVVRSGHRCVDTRRCGPVPSRAHPRPGSRGPALLPEQVRRSANARGLRRSAPRRGRARIPERGAAECRGRHDAAHPRVAVGATNLALACARFLLHLGRTRE